MRLEDAAELGIRMSQNPTWGLGGRDNEAMLKALVDYIADRIPCFPCGEVVIERMTDELERRPSLARIWTTYKVVRDTDHDATHYSSQLRERDIADLEHFWRSSARSVIARETGWSEQEALGCAAIMFNSTVVPAKAEWVAQEITEDPDRNVWRATVPGFLESGARSRGIETGELIERIFAVARKRELEGEDALSVQERDLRVPSEGQAA